MTDISKKNVENVVAAIDPLFVGWLDEIRPVLSPGDDWRDKMPDGEVVSLLVAIKRYGDLRVEAART